MVLDYKPFCGRAVFLFSSTTRERAPGNPAGAQWSFIDWMDGCIYKPRLVKVIFFLISDGVKRKGIKETMVKYLYIPRMIFLIFKYPVIFPIC